MIEEGTRAPDFVLPGASPDGHAEITEYRLSDAITDGPAVLSFYVFDFHPECTEHMCDLNNLSWFGIDSDVTAFGISSDRSFSHRAFAEAQDLDFPLLSDSDGTVAEAFGVLYEEFRGHKRVAKRSTFVVDTDRTVQYAWSTEDPSNHPDWTTVADAVQSLPRAGSGGRSDLTLDSS